MGAPVGLRQRRPSLDGSATVDAPRLTSVSGGLLKGRASPSGQPRTCLHSPSAMRPFRQQGDGFLSGVSLLFLLFLGRRLSTQAPHPVFFFLSSAGARHDGRIARSLVRTTGGVDRDSAMHGGGRTNKGPQLRVKYPKLVLIHANI